MWDGIASLHMPPTLQGDINGRLGQFFRTEAKPGTSCPVDCVWDGLRGNSNFPSPLGVARLVGSGMKPRQKQADPTWGGFFTSRKRLYPRKKHMHQVRESIRPYGFLPAGVQFGDVLQPPWAALRVPPWRCLQKCVFRGRDVDDAAIVVPHVACDLHILPQHGLLRTFQDLGKHAAPKTSRPVMPRAGCFLPRF